MHAFSCTHLFQTKKRKYSSDYLSPKWFSKNPINIKNYDKINTWYLFSYFLFVYICMNSNVPIQSCLFMCQFDPVGYVIIISINNDTTFPNFLFSNEIDYIATSYLPLFDWSKFQVWILWVKGRYIFMMSLIFSCS